MRTVTLLIFACLLTALETSGQELNRAGRASSSRRTRSRAEHPAEFPGGSDELGKYLAKRLRYPASLQRAGIYPLPITVSFTVAETGAIENVEILKLNETEFKRLQPYLIKVVSVVEKMPLWKPATIGQMAVSSRHIIPVTISVQ